MPPKPDLSFVGLDDSVYKFKISETITACVGKPKEDRSSAPLIEDWETDSDDDNRMAKKSVLPTNVGKGTGHRESRPVWNNVQRINHQNKFAPIAIFTRSGRILVSAAKPKATTSTNATKPVNTADLKQSEIDLFYPKVTLSPCLSTQQHQVIRRSAGGPSSPHPNAFIPANTLLHVDQDNSQIPDLEETAKLQKADCNNMESSTIVSPIPTQKMEPKKVSQALDNESWVEAMQKELLIEAIVIFLAFTSFMGFIVYQIDIKNAFLYGTIEEEVYVSQPYGFIDPQFLNKVYRVEKALYGLHQTPKAWYLKGQPKLGLWYLRDSSFDLKAYSDSDYAGANLDRKSTTGGCQFLGRNLISWQCKKQTIVATSTTEAEYVAVAHYCGPVL
nr:ribonuclease H-like domain, reverse transcriptase, RNA-dependent DNA polymerase [Tanacetum cinerariifolium]